MTDERISAPCRCGKVELQIIGAPILRGICYCASCQEAGRRYRAVPGADSVLADSDLAEDGGTDYALYRTIFPQMTGCLPEDEGAQLRFDFETELARLEAA
jgi:hypothetical protein